MFKDVPSATEALDIEVEQAQEFIETLPSGKHAFTSNAPEVGYNLKSESWNWFFAIGGYSTWGRGIATVTSSPAGPTYDVDYEYRFFDRYNWDGGKEVTIFGVHITDEFMGEFHRQGLAQEFNCFGSIKRKLSWKRGEQIPQKQIRTPQGGR